ncbi:MAG: ABC transporter permease [Rhodospirillales bacterium]
MNGLFRGLVILAGLLAVWQAVVILSGVPTFILPPPASVFRSMVGNAGLLAGHAGITLAEILAGLVLGTGLGCASALLMSRLRPARRWLLPVLVASQAVPVFALAPILVLWLGYGMASKVAMATLIIYFPVTATFYDGLRRTEPGWLDMAATMNASPWATLRHIQIPAALPAFASGLKVSAAVAPIGAVVGEWVGSSAGLGYLMLHANAQLKTDLMFAGLVVLAAIGLTLYFTIDALSRRLLPWQSDDLSTNGEP